ncbi:LOW QUALITY PROTEIN: hypothetical protein MXB_2225 [Myxobolus squamalis]|nr:LOW QUALITY PROTEIN: hypothetical protein MXB_2225 [Myxobolus squamalis]
MNILEADGRKQLSMGIFWKISNHIRILCISLEKTKIIILHTEEEKYQTSIGLKIKNIDTKINELHITLFQLSEYICKTTDSNSFILPNNIIKHSEIVFVDFVFINRLTL